jgi:hypothetical protein
MQIFPCERRIFSTKFQVFLSISHIWIIPFDKEYSSNMQQNIVSNVDSTDSTPEKVDDNSE